MHLPQDTPSRGLPNKLINDKWASTSEGCSLEGEVNTRGFPARLTRKATPDFTMCQVPYILSHLQGFQQKVEKVNGH